ncbi:hypothetical protein SLA2020_420530 [Shorea laevis]
MNHWPCCLPKASPCWVLANTQVRPLRWHMSHYGEICDSKAGAELLDIILMKVQRKFNLKLSLVDLLVVYLLVPCNFRGSWGELPTTQFASSPPYFCGSPPSRSSNPLIQDARFGDEKFTAISPLSIPSPSSVSSPSSSSRKGGCTRMKFGLKPAAVRVEGFDCLSRDCQNSSIPAVA